jgi:hypothetical protein
MYAHHDLPFTDARANARLIIHLSVIQHISPCCAGGTKAEAAAAACRHAPMAPADPDDAANAADLWRRLAKHADVRWLRGTWLQGIRARPWPWWRYGWARPRQIGCVATLGADSGGGMTARAREAFDLIAYAIRTLHGWVVHALRPRALKACCGWQRLYVTADLVLCGSQQQAGVGYPVVSIGR